jgi:membrane protease YdiL (CAAX protease family)
LFLCYGAAFLVLAFLNRIPNFELVAQNSPWIPKYIGDALAFVISIIIIWRVSKGKFRDYGFTLANKNLKIKISIVLAVILAFVGILLSYLSKIIEASPETGHGYPLTLLNVLGMMSFQWIFVGIFEEPLNRGLIQTHLMNKTKGTVRILRWNFHIGTVVTAIIFGVGHFGPHIFFGGSWFSMVPHLLIAVIVGLGIGYIYQETRSLVGPILMHNIYDGLVTTIGWLY